MTTAVELKRRIEDTEKGAIEHSLVCGRIIDDKGLAAGLEYCQQQGIEPPQCSLTAESANADMLRVKAARMLSETKWWKRRLRNQASMQFELEQMKAGNVTNVISDASLAYYKANK